MLNRVVDARNGVRKRCYAVLLGLHVLQCLLKTQVWKKDVVCIRVWNGLRARHVHSTQFTTPYEFSQSTRKSTHSEYYQFFDYER